jgi:hypothetical protein
MEGSSRGLRYYLSIWLDGLRKASFRIVDIPVEIRSGHLPNKARGVVFWTNLICQQYAHFAAMYLRKHKLYIYVGICQFIQEIHSSKVQRNAKTSMHIKKPFFFTYVEFELLTAALMKTHFFCLLHGRFLIVLLFDPEDGGNGFLRKVSWLSTDYTALYSVSESSFFCTQAPMFQIRVMFGGKPGDFHLFTSIKAN